MTLMRPEPLTTEEMNLQISKMQNIAMEWIFGAAPTRPCHICGRPGATVPQDKWGIRVTHQDKCDVIFYKNEEKANE